MPSEDARFALDSRLLMKVETLNTVADVESYRAWTFDLGNVMFYIDSMYTDWLQRA